MGVDLGNDIKDVSKKVTSYKEYKEFSESIKNLKETGGDSFEKPKQLVVKVLNAIDPNKRKQNNTCTPFLEELLKLLKTIKGSGSDTDKFIKKLFVNTLKDSKKGIVELLVKLAKEFLNCGSNQSYQINSNFYIPVDQIDLFGVLQSSPTDKIGKFFYEEKPVSYAKYVSTFGLSAFTFNRELYNLTQNLNQPFSVSNGNNYVGTSMQNLFDITYVESYVDIAGTTINGNFFKVNLKPRQKFPTIDEFLTDYYSSINVIEFKTFFTYLVDYATGAISFGQQQGKSKLKVTQKVMEFNRRISCLCSDTKKEISVGGTSKLSEIDNTNDSFFELDDVDVRIIEQNISDIKLGIIEFEDCDNVKVTLNVESSIQALEELNFNEDTTDINELNNALNIIYPATDQTFQASLDQNFFKQFINAMVASILSPKTILPFMVMLYATNQPLPKYKFDIEAFAKNFRSYYIKFVSSLVAKITEKVFKILKEEILKLVKFIHNDITAEQRKKRDDMILSIVSLLVAPFNFISDFKQCKSCVDELLKMLKIVILVAKKRRASSDVPLPLLLASDLLDGFSSTRAFINVVDELKSMGVPVGPMPDGSPNEYLANIFAAIKGQEKENNQNGKITIGVRPTSVTPTGLTLPITSYGKST